VKFNDLAFNLLNTKHCFAHLCFTGNVKLFDPNTAYSKIVAQIFILDAFANSVCML